MFSRNKILFCIFTTTSLLILLTRVVLAIPSMYQRCEPNTECVIGEYIFEDDGYTPTTTDNYCKITITDPSDIVIVNQVNMSDKNDGWYYYSTSTLSTEGLYRCLICCDVGGTDEQCLDKTFIVGTSFNNLAEKVWSYTSSIGTNLIQNLGDAIWNSYSGARKLTSRQIGTSTDYISRQYDVELIRKATFDFAGFADAGCSSSTLVDSELSEYSNNHWQYYTLIMMDGDNAGQRRAVASSTASTLYLDSAFDNAISEGDKYVISHEDKLIHKIWNWTGDIVGGVWNYTNVTGRKLTEIGTLAADIWNTTYSGVRKLTSRYTDEGTPVDLAQVADVSSLALEATAQDIKKSWVGAVGTADSGSTTTLVDSALTQTNDFWNGMSVIITGGTNAGEVRQIEDFDAGSDTIIVTTAFTSAIDNTSEYLIRREYIGTPDDLSTNPTLFARIKDIRTKLDQLDTLESKLDTIDGVVDAIRASQQLDYTVELSDVGEVETTKTYRAKLTILNYESLPVDANTTPTITIYDALRTTAVTSTELTKLSDGIYEYTYEVPDDASCGLWESVVSVDLGGASALALNDYWEVEGSPAQVIINSMSDTTVPSISANVTISNEGNSGYEYQYEWCVVTTQDNQCGGDDDVDYASAAKYLGVGEDYTSNLSLTVSNTGDYWFKVVVYYGTEASGASRTFTATEEEEPAAPPAGGGAMPAISHRVIYNKLLEVQNELGYHGTGRTAYKDLSNTRYSLGALPNQLSEPLYMVLSGVSSNIQAIGGTKAYSLNDIYEVLKANSTDLKYIVNKSAELRAIIEVNKSLISRVANEPIIQTWFTEGSIILNILVINPPDSARTITVKEYLPKEIRAENIIKIEKGLRLEYDPNLDNYYVTGEVKLGPGERKIFKIETEDVFTIPEDELVALREQAETLMEPLKSTNYFAQGTILKSEIDANINAILREQAAKPTNIEKRISLFRKNQKDLEKAQENIDALQRLLAEQSGKSGILGSLFGVSTTMTWAIIVIVIVGVLVLMISLYALLTKQRALEHHISGGKKLKAPPIVDLRKQAIKIKGGFTTYLLPPFGKPLIDVRGLIKVIKILIIVGILIILVSLAVYFIIGFEIF